MQRIIVLAAVVFSTSLGGCAFSVGSSMRSGSDRVEQLEERIARAERSLGIAAETQP